MGKLSKTIIGILIVFSQCSTAFAACESTDGYWSEENRLPAYDDLMSFFQCKPYETVEKILNDRSACNWFLTRSLEKIYGYNEFTPERSGWKTANQIATIVENSSDWTAIGPASDQAALISAAKYAKENYAVIATSRGSVHGHVALVLPGPLKYSGSWKLKVPNSASQRLDHVNKSYAGCKLSWAWSSPANVKLFRLEKRKNPVTGGWE